jgi:hypothetical protein
MDGSQAHPGKIDRHFWLTRSVARVMGISLSKAMSDGRLNPSEYSEMVARCRMGHCHDSCEKWLANQLQQADSAPPLCLHRALLNGLRDK